MRRKKEVKEKTMMTGMRMLKNDIHYLGLLFGIIIMGLSIFVSFLLAYETNSFRILARLGDNRARMGEMGRFRIGGITFWDSIVFWL